MIYFLVFLSFMFERRVVILLVYFIKSHLH